MPGLEAVPEARRFSCFRWECRRARLGARRYALARFLFVRRSPLRPGNVWGGGRTSSLRCAAGQLFAIAQSFACRSHGCPEIRVKEGRKMRPEHWLYTIPLRLRSLFRRAQADQELGDELRDHLERKTEEYVAEGMTQEEAHRRARIDLDGIEQTKEKCRDARRVNWIQDFFQDLRFGFRMWRKSPSFTAVAILTLALGIGANTAIFSLVNGVLFRPLAYQESNQLYLIQVVWSQMSKFYPLIPANLPGYQIWQKQCHSFEDIAIAEGASADLTGSGEPKEIHGVRGSANLFALLGVSPALGRDFLPMEDESGRGRVVILTNRFWRGYFRSDPAVIGRAIILDGVPFTVVGVLPASFHFPAQLGQLTTFGREIDFFEPLNGPKDDERDLVGEFDFAAIGR